MFEIINVSTNDVVCRSSEISQTFELSADGNDLPKAFSELLGSVRLNSTIDGLHLRNCTAEMLYIKRGGQFIEVSQDETVTLRHLDGLILLQNAPTLQVHLNVHLESDTDNGQSESIEESSRINPGQARRLLAIVFSILAVIFTVYYFYTSKNEVSREISLSAIDLNLVLKDGISFTFDLDQQLREHLKLDELKVVSVKNIVGLPTGADLLENPFLLTWTPQEGQSPAKIVIRIDVAIAMAGGDVVELDLNLNCDILESPNPPLVKELTPIQLFVGDPTTIRVQLLGADPDSPPRPIVFDVDDAVLPMGAQFNQETSTFQWTPQAEQFGKEYEIVFRAFKRGIPDLSTEATLIVALNEEKKEAVELDQNIVKAIKILYMRKTEPVGIWIPAATVLQLSDNIVLTTASTGKVILNSTNGGNWQFAVGGYDEPSGAYKALDSLLMHSYYLAGEKRRSPLTSMMNLALLKLEGDEVANVQHVEMVTPETVTGNLIESKVVTMSFEANRYLEDTSEPITPIYGIREIENIFTKNADNEQVPSLATIHVSEDTLKTSTGSLLFYNQRLIGISDEDNDDQTGRFSAPLLVHHYFDESKRHLWQEVLVFE